MFLFFFLFSFFWATLRRFVAGFDSALWRDVLGDMCSRMPLCFSFSTSFLPLEEENLVSKVRRVVLVSVDS
jgi:hypothetical protein